MATTLSLDYETASEAPLTGTASVGLHNYATHLSTRALMLAWAWNDDPGSIEQADFARGDRLTPEVRDALLDPHVEKWGYNSQFERVVTRHVLGIETPTEGWRCTMALAYMRSFAGGLADVGVQLGLEGASLKDPNGSRLIRQFCQPQRLTKNQPHLWRDRGTDPGDWGEFLSYNRRDVSAEIAIKQKLIRWPMLPEEWRLYEIDQHINDNGMPVDVRFVENAIRLVARRKAELLAEMRDLTGLANPNSTQQILPWLKDRGYPFDDLQKATVQKVLAAAEGQEVLSASARAALRLRQQSSRSSVKKYDGIARRVAGDGRLRYAFQFAGATRTNRWAGRGVQPQNLVRTPKQLESEGEGSWARLVAATDAIRDGDYDTLSLIVNEPMTALAGCLRSSFAASGGDELAVCDLSAIESAVIAWLSGCHGMLEVFRLGLDPYKSFAVHLYNKLYEEISKAERTICKPPVLGCGFGLGGGLLRDGKRTGLWGYAENMGVDITQEEAARQVQMFRAIYPEIPAFWQALQRGIERALQGVAVEVGGLLRFERRGEFLTVRLPSGRLMFYHRPKMVLREFQGNNGRPYTRNVFTCMGMSQVTKKWGRIMVGSPKMCENVVQAVARDVLGVGVRRSHDIGFPIVGTVHDEIITLRRRGHNQLTLDALRDSMIAPIAWAKGLPLGAAGYVGQLYVKD